jgi:predicted ABC-type ATPase
VAKELIVVGGPNGAGKTTFALEYAALRGCAYWSADAIAANLSPGDPASARMAAGREFLRCVRAALASNEAFVVESTLSGRSFQQAFLLAMQNCTRTFNG